MSFLGLTAVSVALFSAGAIFMILPNERRYLTRYHELQHRMGWFTGRISHFETGTNRVVHGFKCDVCRQVSVNRIVAPEFHSAMDEYDPEAWEK